MKANKILIVGRVGSGITYKHLPQTLKELQKETKGKLYRVMPKSNKYYNKIAFSNKYWKDLDVHEYSRRVDIQKNDILFVEELMYCSEYPKHNNIIICVQSLGYAKNIGLELEEYKIIESNISPKRSSFFKKLKKLLKI